MRSSLVVRGGVVVTGEGGTPAPLDLIVIDGIIRDLVPRQTVVDVDMAVLDARGALVIPGFINAHMHSQANLSKGTNERWTLEMLLNAYPWLGGKRNPDIHYVSAQLGAADLIRTGCTAAFDLFSEFPAPTRDGVEAVARAYHDVGLRAVVAPMMADRSFYAAMPGLRDVFPPDLRAEIDAICFSPGDESLARCRAIIAGWPFDMKRIRPALAPTISHHCSDAFLMGCRDLASDNGLAVQMHVAESRVQAVVAPRVHGSSAVRHLEKLGLLGPQFTAAHAVWISDDDARCLADHGCSVAHNPASNLRLGSGVAPIRRYLDAGVCVAIGTDGAITSDSLNMFGAVRLSALVSRLHDQDSDRWLSSAEAFHAGTLGGAKVLGFDKAGRIAKGCNADLVLLDLDAAPFVPLNDAVNQLVYGEDGTAIISVLVGGRLIWERGRFLTIDYPELIRRARAIADDLREAVSMLRAKSESYSPFVRYYCAGLDHEGDTLNRGCLC